MASRARPQGGFTLIELLVSIAVLATLGGVAVLGVNGLRSSATSSACRTDERILRLAEQSLQATTGAYGDENALVAAGLLDGPSSYHDVTSDGLSFTIVAVGECSGGGDTEAADASASEATTTEPVAPTVTTAPTTTAATPTIPSTAPDGATAVEAGGVCDDATRARMDELAEQEARLVDKLDGRRGNDRPNGLVKQLDEVRRELEQLRAECAADGDGSVPGITSVSITSVTLSSTCTDADHWPKSRDWTITNPTGSPVGYVLDPDDGDPVSGTAKPGATVVTLPAKSGKHAELVVEGSHRVQATAADKKC